MPAVPYATPLAMPTASRRPTSVSVLGIIGILLAAISLLSPFFVLIQWAAVRFLPNLSGRVATTSPVNRMYASDLLAWTVGSTAVHAVLGGALLWASIASLRLRPSGRRGMLAYACVALPWSLIVGIVNGLYVMPKTFAAIYGSGGFSPAATYGIAVVSGVLGGLFGTIFPGFILALFRQPHVVAAFVTDDGARRESAAFAGR